MRRLLGVLLIAAIAAVVVAVASGQSSSGGASGSEPAPFGQVARSSSSHVVVIVMENKEEQDVIGTNDAPYLTRLARRYASLSGSYGVRHPSLPNYIALTSGSTHGITDDCEDCHVDAPNIVDQLQAKHISWKAYMEGMPRRCFTASSGDYRRKHDPFIYYDNIRRNPARCRKIVPLTELAGDLRRDRLPTFAWITPDMCNDTHDCSVQTGDRFLARVVPGLLKALGPQGFLVVTYDEGRTAAGCCGGEATGGQIATVVAGPRVRRGFKHRGAVDHYGTLATIERALGLRPLGHAKNARSGRFTDVFRSPPRIRAAS